MAGSSHDSVQKQIMGKLDSILHQFSREMHAVADIFHNLKVKSSSGLILRVFDAEKLPRMTEHGALCKLPTALLP